MRISGLGVTAPVQTIAATIQKVEGYYPGSLAYRNNNPGNLVYVGQAGATADSNGYAVFPSYQDGLNALYNQINLYAGRGMTIDQMMQKYCPPEIPGCDPTSYAQTVAAALGVSTSTLVADAIGSGGTGTGIDAGTGLPLDSGISADSLDLSATPAASSGAVLGLAAAAVIGLLILNR